MSALYFARSELRSHRAQTQHRLACHSWRDNVFVERLWRTIKHEEVYPHAYESVSYARTRIGHFIEFYNSRQPHSSLGKKTPDEFYFASLPAIQQAA